MLNSENIFLLYKGFNYWNETQFLKNYKNSRRFLFLMVLYYVSRKKNVSNEKPKRAFIPL